jgi:DNA repair protein RecN (Recombination protein N)
VIATLRIRDLAIVDRTEIEFGPGLNVLTGETGAGKSIVLGALALLAGGRAAPDAVREGAAEALVEAVFRTGRLPELEAELRERGLEPDDHELVVSRSVGAAGRGRAQVAGRLVPVSALAELFGGRLEFSSQHESQALRRPESHGLVLDAFAGLLEPRARIARAVAELRALAGERAALEAAAVERARRQDLLAFELGEIDAVGLAPGELTALASEHARLAHAEELRGAAASAAAALAGEAEPGDGPAAADRVREAARGIEAAARIDARLVTLGERLVAAHGELADLARELERYADAVEVDPARRAAVEERLAELERLRRKYGRSEEEILARRHELAAELASIAGSDERVRELRVREAQQLEALAAHAASLSAARAAAAGRLAREVEAQLVGLAMPGARLEVALEPVSPGDGLPCGPQGAESVALRLSANPGEAPRDLRRIASGGELSRVFLALKNVLRRTSPGMVLVFDEVDAGVGGRIADRVGAVLAELAAEHQVLCITHLPQIAARATTHLRVTKRVRGGRTVVEVAGLDAAARVEELARMAGGATVTDATRRHARELLQAGRRRTRAPDPHPKPVR